MNKRLLNYQEDTETIEILLVEDNDINQIVAQEILGSVGLTDVDTCESGDKAILAVKNKNYSLVLMDIQMPIMDGLEATRNIRKMASEYPKLQKLPIIAMTSHTSANDIEICLSAGMNDHLSKPIDPETFTQKVKYYLNVSNRKKISEDDQSLINLPGIDIKDGLNRLQGNWALYRRLLLNFKFKHHKSVSVLAIKISNEQWDSAKQLTHTIKGSSGNLGAKELYQQSSKLEYFCIEQNKTEALKQLDNVSDAMRELMISLQSLPEETEFKTKKIDNQEKLAKHYLKQYIQYLDSDLNKADAYFFKAQENISSLHSSKIDKIKNYLYLFDIDATKKATEQLIFAIEYKK